MEGSSWDGDGIAHKPTALTVWPLLQTQGLTFAHQTQCVQSPSCVSTKRPPRQPQCVHF